MYIFHEWTNESKFKKKEKETQAIDLFSYFPSYSNLTKLLPYH